MRALLFKVRCRYRLSAFELACILEILPETLARVEGGHYDVPEVLQELERRLQEAGLDLK